MADQSYVHHPSMSTFQMLWKELPCSLAWSDSSFRCLHVTAGWKSVMIEKVNAPLTQVYKLMLQTRAALPFLLYFYFFS